MLLLKIAVTVCRVLRAGEYSDIYSMFVTLFLLL